MATALFKEYQPGVATYAKRITSAEWEQHKAFLTGLHNRRVSRRKMLDKLAERGFEPSMGQLVSKMKQWDMMVLSEHSGSGRTRHRAASFSQEARPRGVERNVSSRDRRSFQVEDVAKCSPGSSLALTPSTVDVSERPNPMASLSFQAHSQRSNTPSSGYSHADTLSDRDSLYIDRSSAPSRASSGQSNSPSIAYMELCNPRSIRKLREVMSTPTSSMSNVSIATAPVQESAITTSRFHRLESPSSPNQRRIPKLDTKNEPQVVEMLSTETNQEVKSQLAQHEQFLSPAEVVQVEKRMELCSEGFWSTFRPFKCCCAEFFDSDPTPSRFSDLYWMLLQSFSNVSTIGHAMCLIYIWYTQSAFTQQEDKRYRTLIRIAADYYWPLTERVNIDNTCVWELAREIQTISDALVREQTHIEGPRKYHSQFKKDRPTFQSRFLSMARNIKIPEVSFKYAEDDPIWGLASDQGMDTEALRIFSLCSTTIDLNLHFLTECMDKVIQRRPTIFSEFGETELPEKPYVKTVTGLASEIRSIMPYSGELSTIIKSITIAEECYGRTQSYFDKHHPSLPPRYAQSFCRSQSGDTKKHFLSYERRSVGKSRRISEVLKAYWVCDVLPLPDRPAYRDLHLGMCEQKRLWSFLRCEVKLFDKKIPPTSRKSGGTDRSPSKRWSNPGSNLSIQTTSSNNSFKKLAFHIMNGDHLVSKASLDSRWSGHMSVDSWKFEDHMEIDRTSVSSRQDLRSRFTESQVKPHDQWNSYRRQIVDNG